MKEGTQVTEVLFAALCRTFSKKLDQKSWELGRHADMRSKHLKYHFKYQPELIAFERADYMKKYTCSFLIPSFPSFLTTIDLMSDMEDYDKWVEK